MAQLKTDQKTKTTRTRKPSAKSSTPKFIATPTKPKTKHGHGDLRTIEEVEDMHDRRYREWRMAQVHTKRELVTAIVIAVLVTFIGTVLTARWYGLA